MELDAYDIMVLEEVGAAHKCNLLLPPAGHILEPFYCIDEIQKDAIAFRNFLVAINDAGFNFKYDGEAGKKNLVVITGCQEAK